MQVNETLAQSAAVVAGGDCGKAWNILSRRNGCLCCLDDGGQIAAVDYDLLYTNNVFGQTRGYTLLSPESWTVLRISAGNRELVLAPRFAAARCDAACEWQNHPGN